MVNSTVSRYHVEEVKTGEGFCMRTGIPKLMAELNTIIADHGNQDSAEEQEAIDLLKQARRTLNLARAKLQEADLRKNQGASLRHSR
jgi:hypothetical protein